MPINTSGPVTTSRLEALLSAPLNSWIALSEDETRVVATADTFTEISALLDELNVDGVILRTPPKWGEMFL